MIAQQKIGSYRFVFYILGLYIILDGIGSIIVYKSQPLFYDHFVRICRIIVGGFVIVVGEKVCQ